MNEHRETRKLSGDDGRHVGARPDDDGTESKGDRSMSTQEADRQFAERLIGDAEVRWSFADALRRWLISEDCDPEAVNRLAANIYLFLDTVSYPGLRDRAALAQKILDALLTPRKIPGLRRLRKALADLVRGCAGLACDESCRNPSHAFALYGQALAVSRALHNYVQLGMQERQAAESRRDRSKPSTN